VSIIHEERRSDSLYIETVTRGHTVSDGSTIRPAECCWHMVFVRANDRVHPLIVGPLTTAGVASWKEGAEILWIKFKLGTFLPHLPARILLDGETVLPGAASNAFWLKSSTWQFPDYENVETFVDRLVREEMLVCDPIVTAALEGDPLTTSARTVRHRFLRSTGLTQNHIRQFQRAQRAAALLRQGISILDAVAEAGYFDQSHLTRSLKHWIGHTPLQVMRLS
jgi:hypothetical protein